MVGGERSPANWNYIVQCRDVVGNADPERYCHFHCYGNRLDRHWCANGDRKLRPDCRIAGASYQLDSGVWGLKIENVPGGIDIPGLRPVALVRACRFDGRWSSPAPIAHGDLARPTAQEVEQRDLEILGHMRAGVPAAFFAFPNGRPCNVSVSARRKTTMPRRVRFGRGASAHSGFD